MEYQPLVLEENRKLSPEQFVLVCRGDDFWSETLPGQFLMLRGLAWGYDPILPRAFSILGVKNGVVELLVKATGKASRLLHVAPPGTRFTALGPLGKGFPAPDQNRVDWLVAGGVGLAPLLMHAEYAAAAGLKSQIVSFYGARIGSDLVLLERLVSASAKVELATEDGSRGTRGRITEPLEKALSALGKNEARPTLFVCGPDPMLEAVAKVARKYDVAAYLSLEGEMACGVGACLVCAVPCHGPKPFRYACVDGPVFDLKDLKGRYA
jgi:dihydroorotate dehydrogenase electron transfer subunit